MDGGRKHSVVNYVFKYDKDKLASFAYLIAKEMIHRGYKPKRDYLVNHNVRLYNQNIYDEHDEKYLVECVNNLRNKGIVIY